MVFSDDFLHFLKIKKEFVEFTKTVVALYVYEIKYISGSNDDDGDDK